MRADKACAVAENEEWRRHMFSQHRLKAGAINTAASNREKERETESVYVCVGGGWPMMQPRAAHQGQSRAARLRHSHPHIHTGATGNKDALAVKLIALLDLRVPLDVGVGEVLQRVQLLAHLEDLLLTIANTTEVA